MVSLRANLRIRMEETVRRRSKRAGDKSMTGDNARVGGVMRRILLAVVSVAALGVVVTPAQAGPGSCPTGTTVLGAGAGVDPRPDEPKVCVYTGTDHGYEVGLGTFTFASTSPVVAAGAAGGPSVCQHTPTAADPDNYTCVYAGGTFIVAAAPTDTAAVFVSPGVCLYDDDSVFAHCFRVYAIGHYDGPGGKTFSVSALAAVCEDDGFWFYCPVTQGHTEDLSAEWVTVTRMIHIT